MIGKKGHVSNCPQPKKNCINKLPSAYTNVHPYVLKTKDITVPEGELATEYKVFTDDLSLRQAQGFIFLDLGYMSTNGFDILIQ